MSFYVNFYEQLNINKRLNNSINMYRTLQKTHYNRNMIKEFTSPGLHLLGPTSNGLGLSIMLKKVKIYFYNAQMLLKPTPVSPECSKMAIQPLFSSNLMEN